MARKKCSSSKADAGDAHRKRVKGDRTRAARAPTEAEPTTSSAEEELDIGSAYEKWIEDFEVTQQWLQQYDLEALLEEGGGFCKISNFLPDFVAEGALQVLENITEEEWEVTEADQQYEDNDIKHRFASTEDAAGVSDLARLLWMLWPTKYPSFSAGRYGRMDHIARHDDRAHVPVGMGDGEAVLHSRTYAAIYYLTKDWRPAYGGQLVDLQTDAKFTPEFNSLVVFKVPRWHMVTAVKTSKPRYSIFGWWLEEGKAYALENEESGDEREDTKEQVTRAASKRKRVSTRRQD